MDAGFKKSMSVATVKSVQNGDDALSECVSDIMGDLIDEVTLGVCFEVHRSAKIGTLFLGDTDPWSHKEHEIVYKAGVDVFGQVPTKKQFECTCPNCQRHLAASRFAPHLEKCMGMGRNSSRIASKRIATSTLKRDSDESLDDDNDNDWTYPEKKRKKPKKEKGGNSNNGSTRKNKNSKTKNGEGSPDSITNYESMSLEDRQNVLATCCGVISEHTKKMCTRSFRCPQHNEDQRRGVRQFLLNNDNTTAHDPSLPYIRPTPASHNVGSSIASETARGPGKMPQLVAVNKDTKSGPIGKAESRLPNATRRKKTRRTEKGLGEIIPNWTPP